MDQGATDQAAISQDAIDTRSIETQYPIDDTQSVGPISRSRRDRLARVAISFVAQAKRQMVGVEPRSGVLHIASPRK